MNYEQIRVKKFMEFFGQVCPEKPIQIDFETCKLRANLMLEEMFELICKGLGLSIWIQDPETQIVTEINEGNIHKFFNNPDGGIQYTKNKEVDLEQVADGVGDGIVVGLGTSIACGIDQEPVNLEIFKSNDSKAWKEEEIQLAQKDYPTAKIEDYGGGLYRLIREDGKVIKSPSYVAADIKSIIEGQKRVDGAPQNMVELRDNT